MPDQKPAIHTPHAINLRALLLAVLVTFGLLAITWLNATLHIVPK